MQDFRQEFRRFISGRPTLDDVIENDYERSAEELYCHGCGERLSGEGFIRIWDAGEPPPDGEGKPGETVANYAPDEWLACSQVCADKIIRENTIPD